MSYESYYLGGWQSGETGGTPITPEALKHIEDGIRQTYSDFAPAGYGLGGACVDVDSWDNATENGWYRSAGNSHINGRTYGYVTKHTDDWIVQEAFEFNDVACITYKARRVKMAGVWYPWEWVNPPMVLGVEYRTTKRYNNKVIYAKGLNMGALPNAGAASYSFGFTENVVITEIVARTETGCKMPFYFSNSDVGEVRFYNNSSTIWVTTTVDWSYRSLIVYLEYVKG